MPVGKELKPFFTGLVEKSKRMEINWEATGQPGTYCVVFSDIAIRVFLEGERHVHVQLLNDKGDPATAIKVSEGDDEWLAATSLINSANRAVTRIDKSMQRAMEELAKEGLIGRGPQSS